MPSASSTSSQRSSASTCASSPPRSGATDAATSGRPVARSIKEADMGILSWIVLGGIAGWLGSMLVNRAGEGLFRDIILGIVGGLVGGWIFAAAGFAGGSGFHFSCLFCSGVVAVVDPALSNSHVPWWDVHAITV